MDVSSFGPEQLIQARTEFQADGGRLQRLAGKADAAGGDRQALQKAAQEFEAVFLNELLKAMRDTVPDNVLFNSKGPTKYYQQMHDAEMARTLATGPARMGIADLIVQQFTRNAAPEVPGQTEAAASGASPVTAQAAAAPAAPLPLPVSPAAPIPVRTAALDRYRSLGGQTRQPAGLARLRQLAQQQGQAVADTLSRYEDAITGAATANDLDPALVLAVVMEESGGDPLARSAKGAVGLMQLMPGTAGDLGVADPADPGANLAGGTRYLAGMLARYDGKLDLALAAYNAGPGNVDKAGSRVPPFRETRNYVERVLRRFRGLGGGTNLAIPGR